MPAAMRIQAKATITGPSGHMPPFEADYAVSVDEWFPPYTYEVADAVTDQAIAAIATPGLTTITCVMIKADQQISVKVGAAGSNVAFQLNAGAPFVLFGTSITALSISNASGSTANVTVMVGGS